LSLLIAFFVLLVNAGVSPHLYLHLLPNLSCSHPSGPQSAQRCQTIPRHQQVRLPLHDDADLPHVLLVSLSLQSQSDVSSVLSPSSRFMQHLDTPPSPSSLLVQMRSPGPLTAA
jgi:hypothetical protein